MLNTSYIQRQRPPAVSVVIPTYNRSTLVTKAVESVLLQTYTDYELVIIDDGSTDNTRESLAPYMGRMRYIYQENRGAASAQNAGISAARGEWVSILASDDEWLPGKLKRQFDALNCQTEECDLCFTDAVFQGNADMKLSIFQRSGLGAAPCMGILDEPYRFMLCEHWPVCMQSAMVRRDLLLELGGFDESLVIGEDADLIFRLGFKTKFCFVNEPLVRIDRTPTRENGLESLLSTRDDRRYSSQETMYSKWLRMAEVKESSLEQPIRELLRLVYYSSIEAKIHDLRFIPACRRIACLRALGDGLPLIVKTLLTRKIKKVLRRSERSTRVQQAPSCASNPTGSNG